MIFLASFSAFAAAFASFLALFLSEDAAAGDASVGAVVVFFFLGGP